MADADDSAMDRVWQLAADCAGTNVAVIAAENLGWVAEEWWGRGGDGRFNLEVLNMTGILSRPLLEQRMRLFFVGLRHRTVPRPAPRGHEFVGWPLRK